MTTATMPTTMPSNFPDDETRGWLMKNGGWVLSGLLTAIGGMIYALKRFAKGFWINAASNRVLIDGLVGQVGELKEHNKGQDREILRLRNRYHGVINLTTSVVLQNHLLRELIETTWIAQGISAAEIRERLPKIISVPADLHDLDSDVALPE